MTPAIDHAVTIDMTQIVTGQNTYACTICGLPIVLQWDWKYFTLTAAEANDPTMGAVVFNPMKRTNPLGISSHLERLSTADVDRQLDLMQSAGIHWIRQEFGWDHLEPTQGAWAFTAYDYIVSGATKRGMQLIGLIPQYNAPTWYRGSNPWNQPPAPSDYAAFAQAVAGHYAGQIPFYEVGNEPNQDGFWYPQANAVAYTAMLKAAYPAIKTADSTAQVISAGLSPPGPETFLTKMYAAGARGSMDYLGYHPYSWPKGPDVPGLPSFSELDNIHTIMTSNGDANLRVVATEVGWPTYSGGVGEATQAAYTQRVYQKITRENYQYVVIACVYDFLDDGVDPANAEHHFGVLRADYSQKPSYGSFYT